ncbi:MAG: alkaline phosphatase family protein [Phycisphaerae bacterium]|nr:alkaline phosphatase family protein [Phycisphaerae bacterium]
MEGKTFRRCIVWGLVFLATGCGTPGPDGPADSYGLNLAPPQKLPAHNPYGAVVFLIDGVNGRIFEEMLQAGELPNFQRYFVERGLYAPRAVANIPSVTLPNLTSIITGRFCGHHGILGINWLDRKTHLFRDYHTLDQKNTLDDDCTAPMLYERFPKDFTVSIFCQPHRGATKFFEDWLSAGPPFVFGWYLFCDRITLFRFGEMMELARKRDQFPRLVCAYLLAPDYISYQSGVSSDAYRNAIRHADRQIGRVLGDFEKAGVLNKLILAVVSDHSHSDVKQHFDLTAFLEQTLHQPTPQLRLCDGVHQEHRQSYYDKFNVIVTGSGERYRAISLRPVVPAEGKQENFRYASWSGKPTFIESPVFENLKNPLLPPKQIDLLQPLLDQPAVDAVAWRTDENIMRVATKKGIVEFSQTEDSIQYRVVQGDDPLGYEEKLNSAEPQAETVTLLSHQWLEMTHGTDYPDLPAQLLAYFQSPRAGDVIVFASPGWDLGGAHKGGHGGIRAEEDMLVPLLLAGPGVPHGRVNVARTVDLAPTLLELLHRPIPKEYDGQSLIHLPFSP